MQLWGGNTMTGTDFVAFAHPFSVRTWNLVELCVLRRGFSVASRKRMCVCGWVWVWVGVWVCACVLRRDHHLMEEDGKTVMGEQKAGFLQSAMSGRTSQWLVALQLLGFLWWVWVGGMWVGARVSWRNPLTGCCSGKTSESRVRAAPCHDRPTEQCGTGLDTQHTIGDVTFACGHEA